MIKIKKAVSKQEIKTISDLAHQIWHQHFTPIIGQQQVAYMLDKFQSIAALTEQIKSGYDYYTLKINANEAGYLALYPDINNNSMMISKIYIKNDFRGRGFGKQLLEHAVSECQNKTISKIWLTVNKNNFDVIKWYEKQGFKKVQSAKKDIGKGFFMDDYIMELII